MQMRDALPAVFALIGNEAKATGTILRAQRCRDLEQMPQSLRVGVISIFKGMARNDENMDGRDRRIVGKSDADFVFVDKRNRDFAARDFAKDGFHALQFAIFNAALSPARCVNWCLKRSVNWIWRARLGRLERALAALGAAFWRLAFWRWEAEAAARFQAVRER